MFPKFMTARLISNICLCEVALYEELITCKGREYNHDLWSETDSAKVLN